MCPILITVITTGIHFANGKRTGFTVEIFVFPDFPANVAYQEFDVPLNFNFHLREFLPNNFYSTSAGERSDIFFFGQKMQTIKFFISS